MDKQTWTPEPWKVNRISDGMPTKEQWLKHCEECWDKTPEKIEPYVITCGKEPDHLHICIFGPGPQNQENAYRIVDAINALQGIPDPAAFVERAKEAEDRIAELKACLQETQSRVRHHESCGEVACESCECGARDARAKALKVLAREDPINQSTRELAEALKEVRKKVYVLKPNLLFELIDTVLEKVEGSRENVCRNRSHYS